MRHLRKKDPGCSWHFQDPRKRSYIKTVTLKVTSKLHQPISFCAHSFFPKLAEFCATIALPPAYFLAPFFDVDWPSPLLIYTFPAFLQPFFSLFPAFTNAFRVLTTLRPSCGIYACKLPYIFKNVAGTMTAPATVIMLSKTYT